MQEYNTAVPKHVPFVHLCGSRYVDRTEDVTEVKVYSNQPKVDLYVDGKLFAWQVGSHIFHFKVPISGKHTTTARTGEYSSTISVCKVEQPNKDYIYTKEGDIVNWFDKDNFDPGCYSVSDTLGEICKSTMGDAIVQRLIAGLSVNRGNESGSAKDNHKLQQMMMRITLQSLLKQAGDMPLEQIRELNDELQRIKKVAP